MADRITDAELRDRLAACPKVASRWVHRSGFQAVVTGCAIEEATLFPLVLYRHAGEEDGCPVFARTLANFRERFTPKPAPAPLNFGDVCRATCTAPARYLADGKCLFVSAACNDLCIDNAASPTGGEERLPLPSDEELRAALTRLKG